MPTSDFGTPVDGCEAPWHEARFTCFYGADGEVDTGMTYGPARLTELVAPGALLKSTPPRLEPIPGEGGSVAPSTQCESRVRPPSESEAHGAAACFRAGPVGAAAGTLDPLAADAGTRSPAERFGERRPVRGRRPVDERPTRRQRTGAVRDSTHDDEEHAT